MSRSHSPSPQSDRSAGAEVPAIVMAPVVYTVSRILLGPQTFAQQAVRALAVGYRPALCQGRLEEASITAEAACAWRRRLKPRPTHNHSARRRGRRARDRHQQPRKTHQPEFAAAVALIRSGRSDLIVAAMARRMTVRAALAAATARRTEDHHARAAYHIRSDPHAVRRTAAQALPHHHHRPTNTLPNPHGTEGRQLEYKARRGEALRDNEPRRARRVADCNAGPDGWLPPVCLDQRPAPAARVRADRARWGLPLFDPSRSRG